MEVNLVDGSDVVAHLVDGQDAPDDHLVLGGDERRHHQAGTVAQLQLVVDVDRLLRSVPNEIGSSRSLFFNSKIEVHLKVFRLAGCGGDGDLLAGEQRVDRRALADVGVADQADDAAPWHPLLSPRTKKTKRNERKGQDNNLFPIRNLRTKLTQPNLI